MLVMGHPQFETQDDVGIGDGIPPIPEWQIDSTAMCDDINSIIDTDVADEVMNVVVRLRNVFQRASRVPFPTTQLHDLTCFVVHRLLLSKTDVYTVASSPITECIRYAIILYLFIVHGPTYYPHNVMLNAMVTKLIQSLEKLESTSHKTGSLDVWFATVGMVASAGTAHYPWFYEKARLIVASLHIESRHEIIDRVKSVLWLEAPQCEYIFSQQWEALANTETRPGSPTPVSPNSMITGPL